MPKSLEFTLKRAEATKNAQVSVQAKWVWDEKLVPQWDTDIKAIKDQMKVVSGLETDMQTKRGIYDKSLDDIHARTVQASAMFKVRYKNVPEKLAVVKNLSAGGENREAILAEALELISKWNELDPTWNPTQTNTLTALQTLRDTAIDPQGTDFSKAKTAWRTQAEIMNTQAAHLDQDCVSWYASAVKVFLAGTPEGDMIRGTVPTTTPVNHAATPTPIPATTTTPPAK